MATLGHAYAGANVERGQVAQHVHAYHCQPSITPRVPRRAAPVPVPELSRVPPLVKGNPFPGAASVTIADGPGAVVQDVHVAGLDGVLRLAGEGAGQYDVPSTGSILVHWLGDSVPAWTWTPRPDADPGKKEEPS